MKKNHHLLLINLGPVQDFIASARRSRDLWFGSYLLAEMSKCVALSIATYNLKEENGLERLIFPAPDAIQDLEAWERTGFNVVNVILARVYDPRAVAEKVQKDVLEFLKIAASTVFGASEDSTLQAKVNLPTDQIAKAGQQIQDLLEFYWVSVPLEGKTYQDARDQVYQLMIARKITRNFGEVGGWAGPVPKSSLDGLRESVIPETAFDTKKDESAVEKSLRLYRSYGVRPGERLCGIGLLKRHGKRLGGKAEEGFMSTSHLAALPVLERMKQVYVRADTAHREGIDQAQQDFLGVLGKKWENRPPSDDLVVGGVRKGELPGPLHPIFSVADGKTLDGRNLFRDRLGEFFEGDDLLEAQSALDQLLKLSTRLGLLESVQPYPYYALLIADGDRMSDALSRVITIDAHRTFSRKLAGFAGDARTVVQEAGGGLIFAGGEDVMAFLPLHTALLAARRLSYALAHTLSAYHSEYGSPTLSAGLVIAHHLEPLSDVLEIARHTEQAAKNAYGRNALAITVVKRSGENTTIGGRWDSLYDRLNFMIDLHRTDEVPDGVAYELKQLERTLDARTLPLEAARILARKKAQRGQQDLSEATRKQLEGWVREVGPNVLADELIVSREFARAMDIAFPRFEKNEGES